MVGWHHQLNGHEFEQTLGDSVGQGSLVCCSPWGHKELDVTEQLNNNHNLKDDSAVGVHLSRTQWLLAPLGGHRSCLLSTNGQRWVGPPVSHCP